MARDTQAPEVSQEGDRTVYKHPAFGQLSAGRVEGSTSLYGSDFVHQRFIRIKITPSQLHRNLCDDNYYAPNVGYIEVDVSEAQWATFVSSLNVGMGVPCTIRSRDGKSMPWLPDPGSRTEQFGKELHERMERAQKSLRDLEEVIRASGLSKVKQAEMLTMVGNASMNIGSNAAFVADRFDEHMEQTVESAKVEVNAYLMGSVQRAGLEALGAKPALTLAYDNGGDHEQPAPSATP